MSELLTLSDSVCILHHNSIAIVTLISSQRTLLIHLKISGINKRFSPPEPSPLAAYFSPFQAIICEPEKLVVCDR